MEEAGKTLSRVREKKEEEEEEDGEKKRTRSAATRIEVIGPKAG